MFEIKKSIYHFLFENRKHEFGCAMLFFDFPELSQIQAEIDPSDIYQDPEDPSFGLEKNPHCTLLFGIHDEIKPFQVEDILSYYEFNECKAYNVSLFEQDKYDVLKFDVAGENLYDVNKELRNTFPYTNEFDYHPHLTIAYLNPGEGKKYVNKFKDLDYRLQPTHTVYSDVNGKEHKFTL